MTFSIGSIIWPSDSAIAIRFYLSFLVKALEALNIKFSAYISDPILLTKSYLNGNLSSEERDAAAATWWGYLDEKEALQNFEDKDVLMARLAICLLTVKEKDAPELGEHLSWFLEVLGFLGADLDKTIKMMESYLNPLCRK